MRMILHITLVSHIATLELKEGGVVKGTREFTVDNDLAKNLLTEIDALLKDLVVGPLSIERVEYLCKDAGLTTERIGQTVADTYNFVLQKERN